MTFVEVKVIAGVFTKAQKQEIIERITEAIVAVAGEAMRPTLVCAIEEVASGECGVGGRLVEADDVKALARGEATR